MRLKKALVAAGCLAVIAAASRSAAQTPGAELSAVAPRVTGGSEPAAATPAVSPAANPAATEAATLAPNPAAAPGGHPVAAAAPPDATTLGTTASPPSVVGRAGLEAETDVTIDRHTSFAASIGYAGPIGASASFTLLRGLGADVRERDGRVKAVCAAPIPHCANGFLLETAAGVHGGRLSLGFAGRAKVDEEDFHGTVGAGLKLSAVRTWNADEGDEPERTWLGPELDVVVKRIGVSVGLLWPVSGELSASPRFAWGVGLVL